MVWKDIPGFEGLYQISDEGEVKSLNYRRTGKEHMMKKELNGYEYRVTLMKNKRIYKLQIKALMTGLF